MIGWWLVVDRGDPEELRSIDDRKARRLASWETGIGGIDWLKTLVDQGMAKQLSADGYPCRWTAAAADVIPLIMAGPPAHKGRVVFGDDSLAPPTQLDVAFIRKHVIESCAPTSTLTIEAWDQS